MEIKTLACQHGTFSFFADDTYVGKSLEAYGNYSEDEVSIFQKCLKPDSVAVEVGANIGALTVPMSRLCKKVFAFEPQPENFGLLRQNLIVNLCNNVIALPLAVGSNRGEISVPSLAELRHFNFGNVVLGVPKVKNTVKMVTLDSALFDKVAKVHFIKADVEGMELDVLKGAEKIITRDRPYLYLECDRFEKAPDLIGWLLDHGYRCFWHRPPLFYKDNPRSNPHNIWNGYIVSINLICVPEEWKMAVTGLDEAGDARIDPQMYERELKRWQRLWDTNPEDPELGFRVAHYHNLMNNPFMARKMIAKNLAIDPKHDGTLHMRGMLDLQDGNYAEGWPAYELRYTMKDREGFGYRDHDAPHWDGTATDKTVLIWCEQGFGDTIMFCRFMDRVLELAPNAILEVPSALHELIDLSNIVPNGRLIRQGRTLPPYDYHCSIPSIPATLGFTTEAEIRRGPYLFADKSMVDSWRKRDTPRIGICCKGGAASERAYSRDIPKEMVMELAKEFGPFMELEHVGQWDGYADTACAITALDLVLTVDTSVAHLSGALGTRTWLMLSSDPDWRWQRDRSDSPWYPSMKIFRQRTFMDWKPVIADIRDHLRQEKNDGIPVTKRHATG